MGLVKYLQSGVVILKFTIKRNGTYKIVKADRGQELRLTEDYFGNRSLIWVSCINLSDEKELWRHAVTDIVRITFNH